MIINAICSQIVNSNKNINISKPNLLSFKGNNEDTFQKNVKPELEFLFNPTLTIREKASMLRELEGYIRAEDIITGGTPKKIFFEIEEYYPVDRRGKRATPVQLIDITKGINKVNYERIEPTEENGITTGKLRDIIIKKHGTTLERYNDAELDYHRYIKDGIFEKATLIDKRTGEERHIQVIDLNNPKNIDAMKRLEYFTPSRSKVTQRLLNATGNKPVVVSVKKLVQDGFGTEQTLTSLIKSKRIKGGYVSIDNDGEQKKVLAVNLNDVRTQEELQAQRNIRCIGIKDLSEQSGVSLTRIEDAILDGEMDAITDLYLQKRRIQVLIDQKSEKNIAAFDKLLFEEKLIKEQNEQQKIKKRHKQQDRSSLVMKLTWEFCPKTRRIAGVLMGENEKMSEIKSKIRELKEALKEFKPKSDERVVMQDIIDALEIEEQAEIKKFYKSVWMKAGTQEYSDAYQRARNAIKQYETNGIDSIEDIEMRNALRELI